MVTAKIRKSGNSTVVVLPPHYVKERNLKIGEEINLEVYNKNALRELWGRGKNLKIDAQKAKDELRKEW